MDQAKLYVQNLDETYDLVDNPLTFDRDGRKLFSYNDELIIITHDRDGMSMYRDRVYVDTYTFDYIETLRNQKRGYIKPTSIYDYTKFKY